MPPSKAIHDQPSPTLSYTQEPNTPLHRPTTTSYQPYQNRRSDSSYSIQALLSQHQLQHKQQTSSPKPRNSVSSQLRQRTHKLSRVFSSRLSSSPSPSLPPLHQHHPQQQRSSSQQRQQQQERSPHGSKSCDALRLIHEETYYSKENSGRLTKHDSEPSSTSSSSSYYPECPVDCDSSLSSGSSPSSPPCQIPSSTIQPLTKKQLAKREKLRRRATNPDDCIIS
ncbi:uncharacterized protein BX664DRAFT_155950 [Halteromyces radiatus]|uniref:uncharacterized protein n=1 Tax=Halteromyces radiatus TaxID=101107 RepID=UPI002220F839|nr:uncharacterized protein BX664DRAFT_155950 [Halteromyces radiatus]KAI8086351.1 hypothetical protein BX664DRAFT_155950 [Halteromyces radiatus]